MLLIIVPYFLFASFVSAASPSSIIINEIAWMGTKTSSNDEWIELRNTTNYSINIEGWTLKATDGSPDINLSGIIPKNSFFLLERTDDSTVPNILADQIYTGALKNTGETLELYDSTDNLIDSVERSSSWLAGNNSTKQTMERLDIKNWQTSQNAGGTPKVKNSTVEVKLQQAQPEKITPMNKRIPEKPSPSIPLIVAIILASFSAVIILILKNKLNIRYNKDI